MIVDPEHLQIILTTSAIKSHPSTFIIDSCLQSILAQPSLAKVHIYIICDGAKISPYQENKYKSGIISQEALKNYTQFKLNMKQKYQTNKQKFTIIERQFRCGFAQNIRYVMSEYVKSDHVMIYQHDYILQREIKFDQVVQMMRKYPEQINYVTFMNLSYVSIIAKMESIPKVRAFLLKLLNKQQNYNFIVNIKQFTNEIAQFFKQKFGMPLIPLNFWYDKVHIASRRFYLDVVFNPKGNYDPNRSKNMKTVTFVEDTFGHCMKWTVDQHPETLLSKWRAFILWEDQPIFYHLSGRTWMTEQAVQGCKIVKQKAQLSSAQEMDLQDFQQMVKIGQQDNKDNKSE